jgi:hypothetical protein
MTGPDDTGIPKGSYAAGRRVRLPEGAGTPVVVFINGMAQVEGRDYTIKGNEILFSRDIIKEELGTGRKLAMFLGLFGTYRKHETIDVQFQRDGRTELAGDLRVFS